MRSPVARLRTAAARWAGAPTRLWQGLRGLRHAGPRPPGAAILHIGRCGSTALSRMLGRTPGVLNGREPLNPRHTRTFERWLLGISSPGLEAMRREARLAGARQYVGSLTFGQLCGHDLLEAGETLAALEERGVHRFVILERRNSLRVLVSFLIARETEDWHLTKGDGPRPPRQVRLKVGGEPYPEFAPQVPDDAPDLKRIFTSWSRWYQDLRREAPAAQVLDLSYEDDVLPDLNATYRRTCAFLGVEAAPIQPDLRRTNPQPLSQLVTNLDEVREDLAGTPFAWMTDET